MLPLTIFLTPSQPSANAPPFDQNSLNTSLYAWGLNSSGQLGDGTTINKPSAVLISNILGGKSFAQIVTGTSHNLAVATDGSLWAWGNNQYGQLGSNTTSNSASPIQVSVGTSFTSVGTANNTSYATDTTGNLYAWGDNSQNQVGDGTTINKSTPVQIYGYYYPNSITYQSWKFLSVGNYSLQPTIYAIRQSDSSLWGWNNTNYLGNNSGTSTATFISNPVQIGTSSWTAVTSGGNPIGFAAGITSTGSLFTWGYNNNGQLGDGTTISKQSPVKIGTSSWSIVSSAQNSVFGITTLGALYAWGIGTSGILGDNTATSKSSPVQIGTSSWTTVSAGLSHAAGITTTGALFAWGLGTSGQLGDGTNTTRSSPVQIPTTVTTTPMSWKIIATSQGLNHTSAAIKTDGTLWTWGENTLAGTLGINISTNSSQSSQAQVGTSSWTTVSVGASTMLAISTTGALFAWGLGASGQLGDGTTLDKSSPVQIGSSSWSKVSAGGSHVAAIDITGALYTWGRNLNGQLGDGTTIDKSSPVKIGSSSWTVVSAGSISNQGNTAAIDINGNLYVWGVNTNGALGDLTTVAKSSPVIVVTKTTVTNTLTGVIWSGCGAWGGGGAFPATGGIRSDGSLYTWGSTNGAQLGGGAGYASKSSPVQIASGTSFNFITGGISNAVAISSTGALYTWGASITGANGNGSSATVSAPTQIVSGTSFTMACAHQSLTGAITTNGTLYLWGTGAGGGLGMGSTANQLTASVSATFSSWIMVDTGVSHTVAISTGGGLFTWGANLNAQLGDNSLTSKTTATTAQRIVSASTFTACAAGAVHGMAIDSAGRLWSWGTAAAGQLGDNSVLQKSNPVLVGSSTWTKISAGASHCMGITTSGALFTWGLNNNGQLGLGDTINRSNPTQVGSSSWAAINCGLTHSTAIDINGNLYVWGQGAAGAIGDGTTVSKSSPAQVGVAGGSTTTTVVNNPDFWTNVSITTSIAAAISSTKSLYTWGNSATGGLGNGTTVNRSSPVSIDAGTISAPSSFSVLFDGSSQYLTATSANFTFASNFTVEGWFYPTNVTGGHTLFCLGTETTGRYVVSLSGTSVTTNLYGSGTTTFTSTVPINTWTHVAVVRNGSTIKVYINGTASATTETRAGTIGNGSLKIAADSGGASLFAGNISNFRVVRGLAVYAANFSAVTSPLGTYNTTTTSILTCNAGPFGSTTISDMSGNAQSITNTGGATANALTPFTRLAPAGSWTAVSVTTGNHMLGLTFTGALYGWGSNSRGQLGLGDTINRSNPVQIGSSSWSAVAVANSRSHALTADGLIYSMGYYQSGIMLNNTYSSFGDVNTPTPAITVTYAYTYGSWKAVSAGLNYTAAIDITGALYTWGLNASDGRLGDGTTISKSIPIQIGTSSWSIVNAGHSHVAAIDITGALYAWGNNVVGTLGDGTTISKSSPVQIGSSSWTAVTAGSLQTYGLTTTGILYAWGQASATIGLGDGTTISKSSPVQIPAAMVADTPSIGESSFKSIISSGYGNFAYAISANASSNIYSWGTNSGVLTSNTAYPLIVFNNKNTFNNSTSNSWKIISAGGKDTVNAGNLYTAHTVAIKSDGSLWSWGSINGASMPVQIGTSSWTTVSAGTGFIAAIDITGALYAWGGNSFGQLGDGTTISKSSFVQIGTSSWSIVNAGSFHTAAIDITGALFTWGDNSLAALGDGTTISKSSPVQIGSSSWSKVSAGSFHTAAIDITGALFTWGYNTTGQLGDGTIISKSSPVQIGTSSWTTVSAGSTHTAAIGITGALYAWGLGTTGQLGDGTTISKSSPVQIGTSSWTSVNAGALMSAGITTTGSLYAWGVNSRGTLADGTILDKSSPVQIGTSSWTSVSTGFSHAAGITANNILFTWGNNAGGALGDGTISPKSSPVVVLAGTTGGSAISKITTTSSGATLFLDTANTITSIGSNSNGELGNLATGTNNNYYPVPYWVAFNTKNISSGGAHNAAISTNNNLYLWGDNSQNQINANNQTSVNTLTPLNTLYYSSSSEAFTANVAAVATGLSHTVFANYGSSTHTIYSLGDNTYGQLGYSTIGNNSNSSSSYVTGNYPYLNNVYAGGNHTFKR
jgi:alpha-tubulin suppressor-like RCC1 family protein